MAPIVTPRGASAQGADRLYFSLPFHDLVNLMHPCCWENMIQGLFQMVPFFALFAVAAKKLWDARPGNPFRRRNWQAMPTGSCCSAEVESLKRQPTKAV
jgi:hypothetical protein